MSIIPNSYKESKARFQSLLPRFQEMWPTSSLHSVVIVNDQASKTSSNATNDEIHSTDTSVTTNGIHQNAAIMSEKDESLAMDVLFADATKERKKLITFITGVHGVEGYLGSALLQRFAVNQLYEINPQTTGICLIHAVNPWGMHHFQRSNEHNVDLNRNFVVDRSTTLDNPAYEEFRVFLQPTGPARFSVEEFARFIIATGKLLIKHGSGKLKGATMTGQFLHPDGIYYGGTEPEPSARALTAEMERLFELQYRNHLVLDLHTGYGKKNRMTCVNSPFDGRNITSLRDIIQYDLITQTAADDFYPIHGDLIDFLYKKYPAHTAKPGFFATCLEFGTGGEGFTHLFKSLWLTISMNRLKQNGAVNQRDAARIREGFRKLFLPDQPAWERAAIKDFDCAMKGLLRMMATNQ